MLTYEGLRGACENDVELREICFRNIKVCAFLIYR